MELDSFSFNIVFKIALLFPVDDPVDDVTAVIGCGALLGLCKILLVLIFSKKLALLSNISCAISISPLVESNTMTTSAAANPISISFSLSKDDAAGPRLRCVACIVLSFESNIPGKRLRRGTRCRAGELVIVKVGPGIVTLTN